MCNGDGQSCLGCETVDVQDDQFALDGQARNQLALIKRARYQVVRGSATRKQRSVANDIVESAASTYDRMWHSAWSYQRFIVSCSNTTFCSSIDISANSKNFESDSNLMVGLLDDVVGILRDVSGDKRKGRNLISKMDKLHQDNLKSLSLIPASQSECS